MENVRKRIDLKIVTNKRSLNRLVKKPIFKERIILTKNLVSIQLEKGKIVFYKPLYVGFSILELSKVLMYKLHYDVFLKTYGPQNINLCCIETDSLLYLINTTELYDDISNDLKHYFDASNFPGEHRCYSDKNKKVVGMLKDETAGDVSNEYIGLRPKMY